MPNILVTGATGLIGDHLIRALTASGQVYALGRSRPAAAGSGITWIPHDLTERSLPDLMPSGIDAVIHLAQSAHFRDFPERALDVFEVNVAATARLLDWCVRSGVSRFVLASSGGVYGSGDHEFTEDEPIGGGQSLGYYPASKHCAELLAESYATQLTVTTLRFFFVYGPRQRRGMLIPRLVESVLTKRAITLQGQDGLTINPIHVEDAVAAIIRCLDLDQGHTINIAGPQILSLRQIGDAIGKLTGLPPSYEVDPVAKPSQIVGDIRKMKRLLGPPTVLFSEGVADVCAALGSTHPQPR